MSSPLILNYRLLSLVTYDLPTNYQPEVILTCGVVVVDVHHFMQKSKEKEIRYLLLAIDAKLCHPARGLFHYSSSIEKLYIFFECKYLF